MASPVFFATGSKKGGSSMPIGSIAEDYMPEGYMPTT